MRRSITCHACIQLLLITCLACCTLNATAQQQRLPKDVAALLIPALAEHGPKASFTELYLELQSGRIDTQRLVRHSYDSLRRRLVLSSFQYSDVWHEPLDTGRYLIRTRQEKGSRLIFDFDDSGRMTSRQSFDILPAGSAAALLHGLYNVFSVDAGRYRTGGQADKAAELTRRNAILDSIYARGIPEIATRTSAVIYAHDEYGNIVLWDDSLRQNYTTYRYSYDPDGRPRSVYGVFMNRVAYGQPYFSVDQTDLQFSPAGQLQHFIRYVSDRDSTNVTEQRYVPLEKAFRRDARGRVDSIWIWDRDVAPRETVHLISFRDTLPSGLTILRESLAKPADRDTASVTTYTYSGGQATQVLRRTFPLEGGPYLYDLTQNVYGADGRLRERRSYSREQWAKLTDSLQLREQLLIFYGGAEDRKTAAASLYNAGSGASRSKPASYNLKALTAPSPPVLPQAPSTIPEDINKPVFKFVEQMPEFPGGRESLEAYIRQRLLQGHVDTSLHAVAQAIIRRDGSVTAPEIQRSSGNAPFDARALEILQGMPHWRPGRQQGRWVDVYMTIPIRVGLAR